MIPESNLLKQSFKSLCICFTVFIACVSLVLTCLGTPLKMLSSASEYLLSSGQAFLVQLFQHHLIFFCSGKGFDWSKFELPPIRSKYGWLLAGGINPENVSEALSALRPHGVDVSSGNCDPDGIQKDESLILSIMNAVRSENVIMEE